MRKRLALLAGVAWIFSPLAPVAAQVAPQPDPAQLAKDFNLKLGEAGARWGVSIIRATVLSVPEARFIAPAEAGKAAPAIETVVNQFNAKKSDIQGNLAIQEGAVNLFADAAAAGATFLSGGSLTVPAAMVRTAVQAGTDDLFGSLRADANRSLQAFLADNRGKILQDTGVTYDALRQLPPEQIRAKLNAGARTFRALDNKVSDPALKEMSRELLVDTIIATQGATLTELDRQGAQIGDLKGRVGNLEKAHKKLAELTVSTLQQQEQSITALGVAVKRVDNALAGVDQRLQLQERSMDVVQDFAFTRMEPAEKANALRSGFMAGRLACPEDQPNCDQSKLRSALIEKYEAQAELKEAVETAGKVVQNVNGVMQIAADLGINVSTDVGRGVAYANAAVNAFASAASGNWVGAVASITGAFAKRGPDPQMKFFQAQFAQINARLTTIIDNQKKLSQQITDLSKRLDDHMDRLHQRFDVVDFRLAQVRMLTAMNVNQSWQGCHLLYQESLNAQKRDIYGYDPGKAQFRTIELASSFGHDHRANFESCSQTISNTLGSFGASGWFGNFLSASTQPSANDDVLKRVYDNRTDTWKVVQGWLTKQDIPAWQAFRLFSSPALTMGDTRRRMADRPSGDPCSSSGPLKDDRVLDLLCEMLPSRGANAADTAEAVLKVPMLTDHAIDVAGWTLLEQSLVDLQDIRPFGAAVTVTELLNSGSLLPTSKGEEHTRRALLTLDAAMANAAMLNGDITVEAVLDVLLSKPLADPATENARQDLLDRVRRMLVDQPALARNVAVAFLKDRLGVYNNGLRTGVKPAATAYPLALNFAQQVKDGDPFTIFATLFGNDLQFRRNPDGRLFLVLMEGKENVDPVIAPMPEPLTLERGTYYYASGVEDLAAMRERVGLRYLDYGALRGLAPEDRSAVTATLARAELVRAEEVAE